MLYKRTLVELAPMPDEEVMAYLLERYHCVPELVSIVFRHVIEVREILEVIHD
jgi:hypothetical protein